jgi:hypothetical protein
LGNSGREAEQQVEFRGRLAGEGKLIGYNFSECPLPLSIPITYSWYDGVCGFTMSPILG